MNAREGHDRPGEEDVPRTVRRKAERMQAARRRPPSLFRELAQVGVLGWVFILPLLAFTVLGRVAAVALDVPGLGLVGLGVGLFAGGWAAYRSIRRSLEPRDGASSDERRGEDR